MLKVTTDKLNMETSKSLATLYDIIQRHIGNDAAKKSLSTALSLVVHEIEYDGLAVTPDLIEIRLAEYVKDYIEVDEKLKAA